MMELSNIENSLRVKRFTMRESRMDRKEDWDIMLQTDGLPALFENATEGRRQVTLQVIGGSDLKLSERNNAFAVPLNLIGVSRIDNKTICYYQSRHESQEGSLLMAKTSATITLSGDKSNPVEDPYLLMEFSVIEQDKSAESTGNDQVFTGQHEAFVRRDAGENANGGLDIPLKNLDGLQQGDRVVAAA